MPSSLSPFALAPKSGLLNDPEKPTSIRIRTFREGDGPRVRELFRLGIGYGPGSSREAALKGSLKRPNSIACYILFVVGLFQFFSTSASACCIQHISGVFLCLVSATFFGAHRWKLNEIIKRHADSDKHPDMADIVKHYKLQVVPTTEGTVNEKESARLRSSVTRTVGPDGFWVAEVVELGGEDGEVVGCVGLDTSTTSPSPHTAELRRMAVSHSLQRRGIGKMLLETALAHATLHDIREVHLSTTGYQASAVGIYEKFGWKLLEKTKLNGKIAPPWVDFKLVHYRLELGGAWYRVGRDVKEWQKMA